MKRLLLTIISVFIVACNRPFIVFEDESPYRSEWIVINRTSCDLLFHLEATYINDNQNLYTDYDNVLLLQQEKFDQKFNSNKKEKSEFLGLFYNLDELIACRVYFTAPNSDKVLKEWTMEADNGEHDFFDEAQWEHRSWEDSTSTYYTIYHNEWTFTITDEDIGVVE